MTLNVNDISDIVFNTDEGSNLLGKIQNVFKALIGNDNQLYRGEIATPTLFERKWLIDSQYNGYSKGDAVWMYLTTPQQIVSQQYDHIMKYLNEAPSFADLRQQFEKINKDDSKAVETFLIKNCVNRIYVLGDTHYAVQIKVSLSDKNTSDPSDTSKWADFFICNSSAKLIENNEKLLSSSLSNIICNEISNHVSAYHQFTDFKPQNMSQLGFFKINELSDESIVKTQSYYDYVYCEHMQGFDYVESFEMDSSQKKWYRKWKSGYLEQGGMIDNNGSQLITVSFMKEYKYPIGPSFYQQGYNHIGNVAINPSNVPYGKRYVFTVTPIAKDGINDPYPSQSTYSGVNIYATVDVTGMRNDSFQIVNSDMSKNKFAAYSWYVAGYVVTYNV